MRILFSHTNHPAQFRRLVPAFVEEGHDVVFLAINNEWHASEPLGYRLLHYQAQRDGGGPAIHPYLRRFEKAILQGQAEFRRSLHLKEEGWFPDVVINHVGFGNGLFLSDAFPQARRIGFFEWFYNAEGSDLEFLHPDGVGSDRRLMVRAWNAQVLMELAAVDVAVTPTQWQLQQFPFWMRDRLRVIHEGIDLDSFADLGLRMRPKVKSFGLPETQKIEVVTYLSRCFEEYRGFPQAMRVLSRLQQQRPNLHVLLVGSDEVAYGKTRSDGRCWRQWAIDELPLDPLRTHWLGVLGTEDYRQFLACSDVHLYLTVPFILSWSLLEAMAAGCCIVGSSTPPVQEAIESNHSGVLVDFFDEAGLVAAIADLLDDPDRRKRLGDKARQAVQRYDTKRGLDQWRSLVCEDTD